jgi:hypothetical protein
MLFVIKGYLPMKIVESIWLQQMAYKLGPRMVFPSSKVTSLGLRVLSF